MYQVNQCSDGGVYVCAYRHTRGFMLTKRNINTRVRVRAVNAGRYRSDITFNMPVVVLSDDGN